MSKFYITLILTLLIITGLNAQEKHAFSEKVRTDTIHRVSTFKKMTTPESTLRWMTLKETEKVPKAEFLQKSKEIFDLDEKTSFKEIRVNEGTIPTRLRTLFNHNKHYAATI